MPFRLLTWLITANCNLNCLHCYTSRFRGHCELNTTEAINIIKEAHEIGIAHISLTGGEPLIRKDIDVLLQEIYEHNISISLVTNGTLINGNIATLLYRYNVFTYISVDGASSRTHDLVRGRGSWSKVMKGISYLRNNGVLFSTVLAVNKFNLHEVKEYVKLAERIGAISACIIPVMPAGRAVLDITPSSSDMIKVVNSVDQASKDMGYQVDIWCYKPAELFVTSSYIRAYGCRTYNVVDMDPSGNLLLCDVLDFKIANVVKLGLRKALDIYRQDKVVRSLVFPKLSYNPCKNCKIKDICKGGCFARSYLITGDLYSPDPLCPCVPPRVSTC